MAINTKPNTQNSQNVQTLSTTVELGSTQAVAEGNFDPLTLQQAIIANVRARQDVPILETGANYSEVVLAWSEAFGTVQNAVNSELYANTDALANIISDLGGAGSGSVSAPTLLFDIIGPVVVGSLVYQNGNNAVSLVDSTSAALGPAIGIVVELPTASTARVQDVGSVIYVAGSFPFLPLVPDSTYYVGTGGEITLAPNPSPGGYIQEIGYSKTDLELVLNIQELTLV